MAHIIYYLMKMAPSISTDDGMDTLWDRYFILWELSNDRGYMEAHMPLELKITKL